MPTKSVKKPLPKKKRKWWKLGADKPAKMPKSKLDELVENFVYIAHHQDLRSGMLILADAINKDADAMRATATGLVRLADLFEEVRTRERGW